jgi:hypothetical protein
MNEGTKWADCAAIVTQVVELTTLFDSDGIQVLTSPNSNYITSTARPEFRAGRVYEQRRFSLWSDLGRYVPRIV